jgi:hypothetical protein
LGNSDRGKTKFLETELGTRLRKAQAPERLVPSGTLSRAEVLTRFEAARAETLEFAENIDAPLEAHTLEHPFPVFGTLNAYQWLLYCSTSPCTTFGTTNKSQNS